MIWHQGWLIDRNNFMFLSRESDGGALLFTSPHTLWEILFEIGFIEREKIIWGKKEVP